MVNKNRLGALIRLLRPKQWVKNTFVFAPLVFSGHFKDGAFILEAFVAAGFFCVASSAIYILNDYHDIEEDRKHSIKLKRRPLASGEVTKRCALILMGILAAVLVCGYLVRPNVGFVIFVYLLLNLAYVFVLKHQPVLDLFTVASGFVLRVYAGAVALSVPVSSWMFATTLCLALYLVCIKRRQELVQQGDTGRRVLGSYSASLVERYAEMSATGALLFYSLFVITERAEMVITIPFVLYGLFRYWFIVESLNRGESPTDALFADKQLIATIVAWGCVCLWILNG